MSHLDDEMLAELVTDPHAAPLTAREHLTRCPECAAAATALRSVADTLRAGSDTRWEAPPASVWAAIVAATPEPAPEPLPATTPEPLPATSLSRLPATAPQSSGAPVSDLAQRRAARHGSRPNRAGWIAAAACLGVLAGLGLGRVVWTRATEPATTLAATALDTLDTKRPLGDAAILRTSGGVGLDVTLDATAAPGGYLEVWLINTDGRRMVSIGVLDATHQSFPISQALLDEGYLVVDVSRESFDDKPQHSGDSVVRGTLSL